MAGTSCRLNFGQHVLLNTLLFFSSIPFSGAQISNTTGSLPSNSTDYRVIEAAKLSQIRLDIRCYALPYGAIGCVSHPHILLPRRQLRWSKTIDAMENTRIRLAERCFGLPAVGWNSRCICFGHIALSRPDRTTTPRNLDDLDKHCCITCIDGGTWKVDDSPKSTIYTSRPGRVSTKSKSCLVVSTQSLRTTAPQNSRAISERPLTRVHVNPFIRKSCLPTTSADQKRRSVYSSRWQCIRCLVQSSIRRQQNCSTDLVGLDPHNLVCRLRNGCCRHCADSLDHAWHRQ